MAVLDYHVGVLCPSLENCVISLLPEQYDFADIQLQPRVSLSDVASRAEINLEIDGAVPIIVANMDTIGTFEIAKILAPERLMVAILKDFSADEWKQALDEGGLDARLLIPTLGLRGLDEEIQRVRQIIVHAPQVRMVCLDVANGYLKSVAEAVRKIKDAFPDLLVCAGNVVGVDGLEHLARAGADVVKVGIGSGGVCITRKMTGIGRPQFSAIHNMAQAAQDIGVQLVSDGGMTDPGAAVKAFAAGASYVMAGSYFAGHEETGTRFHGMSSDRSRQDRGEGVAGYRASEGREVILAPKGSLGHTVRGLLGGLRSACTYLGVKSLTELREANLQAVVVRRQLNRIEGIAIEDHG